MQYRLIDSLAPGVHVCGYNIKSLISNYIPGISIGSFDIFAPQIIRSNESRFFTRSKVTVMTTPPVASYASKHSH